MVCEEVVTIMMSLFDEEQIMKVYIEDYGNQKEKEGIKEGERRTARDTAKRMIEDGDMSLDKIARYVPTLTLEELKELEAGVSSRF
jgi:hypothetical protein